MNLTYKFPGKTNLDQIAELVLGFAEGGGGIPTIFKAT